MSRTIFVDKRKGSFQPAGTMEKPFGRIQDAVAAAADRGASAADPIAIAILQGIYDETVVIDVDGVSLRGLGGVGTVRIRPSSGPAVVITSAAAASVVQFAGTKDPAVLQTSGKPASPERIELVDLYLEATDAASPTVCIVGDPKRTPIGGQGITLSNCMLHHNDQNGKALLAYYAQFIRVRHNCELTAPTEVFNCSGFWVDDSDVQAFVLDFDPTAAPAPGGIEFGLVGSNASFLGPFAEIRGVSKNTIQPTLNTMFFDLVLRDQCTFNMIGGCANDVTAEGGASWIAEGVHVRGKLDIAAGPGKVRMDAGRYMGALNDPSKKLVRNLGN